MGKIIGIDLGTTNSCVYVMEGKDPKCITNPNGGRTTPSVVAFTDKERLVGDAAKRQAVTNSSRTVFAVKRLMGRMANSPEVEHWKQHAPYKIVAGANGAAVVEIDGHQYTPQEVSATILSKLKADAEAYLGEPVTEAVITVPAYFNDAQRQATKDAGQIAGLDVKRIINEPTAASLAYGFDKKANEKIVVFDLGGGTFDVSILELYHGIMEVHAIAGDNFIGGEDFTNVLAQLFLDEEQLAPETLSYQDAWAVHAAAEQCKLALSKSAEAEMTVTLNGAAHTRTFSLARFEAACAPLLEKIRGPIERSLRDASVHMADIDEIVLVGGATKSPVVRRFVAKLFGRIPNTSVDPDEAIAIGAAVQCGMKERSAAVREIILTDVCPFTLGTEVCEWDGEFRESGHYLPIIERNTVIPVSRTETVYPVHDDQKQVCVKILQGESRLAANNLLLGELNLPIPPHKKGEVSIDITYTYDVNALLEVEAQVQPAGTRRRVVIQNEPGRMTDEEADARLAALSYLKLNPRNEEENKLALFRGERMYEQATGSERAAVDRLLAAFERALRTQDRTVIDEARRTLTAGLDAIDADNGFS